MTRAKKRTVADVIVGVTLFGSGICGGLAIGLGQTGGGTVVASSAQLLTVTTTPSAQAYCEQALTLLLDKYPKVRELSNKAVGPECSKMLAGTGAKDKKAIDALLAAAETYYKAI